MSGRFVQFRDAVVSQVKALLPELAECEAQFGRFVLDDLKTRSINTPGVRISIIAAPLQQRPDGSMTSTLECAAFVVCDGRDRDNASWSIAEGVGTLLHSTQRWGLQNIAPPQAPSIKPILQATDRRNGLVVIAVEWKQTLHLIGDGLIAEDGIVYEGYYITQSDVTDEFDNNDQLIGTEVAEEPEADEKPWAKRKDRACKAATSTNTIMSGIPSSNIPNISTARFCIASTSKWVAGSSGKASLTTSTAGPLSADRNTRSAFTDRRARSDRICSGEADPPAPGADGIAGFAICATCHFATTGSFND